MLGAARGRAKFLARLGPEANDALDEFLNLALDYETRATPSLQGFLAWLRAAQSEVKRDMEMVRDEVRVMTVHGAKGLEAGTVILADTTTKPTGPKDPRLLPLTQGELVWATAQSEDVGAMSDARNAAQKEARDEYRRLLYVAMTRAKERLVIAGTQGRNKIPDGCWYQLVEDTLQPDCVAEPADDGAGEVWRYRKRTAPAEKTGTAASSGETKPTSVPEWLRSNASSEISGVRTVTPSQAEDDAARAPAGGGRAAALCCAASWCTGCCSRCRISRPNGGGRRPRTILSEPAKNWSKNSARRSRKKSLFCSAMRLSPNCSRPAAAPKFPSSAGLSSPEKPCACPARSTAWR